MAKEPTRLLASGCKRWAKTLTVDGRGRKGRRSEWNCHGQEKEKGRQHQKHVLFTWKRLSGFADERKVRMKSAVVLVYCADLSAVLLKEAAGGFFPWAIHPF